MPTAAHQIAPPDSSKEVSKANVYERSISLNCQLAPLFPHMGPGDIVVTAVMQRGHPDKEHGLFYHTNTQEEVTLVLASNLSKVPLGTLMVSSRFHGVTTMFADNHNPEAFMMMLIVQRQKEADKNPSEQQEGFGLNCSNCQQPLLRAAFNADPTTPQEHGTRAGDQFSMFSTIWGCHDAADRFNHDIALRTCTNCGHVSEPFPLDTWGWQDWVAQNRVANAAVAAMTAAGAALQTTGVS